MCGINRGLHRRTFPAYASNSVQNICIVLVHEAESKFCVPYKKRDNAPNCNLKYTNYFSSKNK